MTSLDHPSDLGSGGAESMIAKSKCNVPGQESQALSSVQRSPRCQTHNYSSQPLNSSQMLLPTPTHCLSVTRIIGFLW